MNSDVDEGYVTKEAGLMEIHVLLLVVAWWRAKAGGGMLV